MINLVPIITIGWGIKLLQELKKKKIYDSPIVSVGTIDGDELQELFKENIAVNCMNLLKTRDRTYRLYKESDIKLFLEKDLTDQMDFEDDFRDCDDFAYMTFGKMLERFPGISAGVCRVFTGEGLHEDMWYVNENREKRLIKCQGGLQPITSFDGQIVGIV